MSKQTLFILLAAMLIAGTGMIAGQANPVLTIMVCLAVLVFLAWRFRFSLGPYLALQRRDFEKAKQLYEKALEKTSGSQAPQLYVGLVHCHLQLCEPEKAVELCDRAIALAPKQGVLYVSRAIATFECCRYAESLKDCEKAVSMGCPLKYVHSARTAAKLGMKDIDDAVADCEEFLAFSIGPAQSVAFINRAAIRCYQGKFDQAISDSNTALKLDPKNALGLNNRAHGYIGAGDFEKAQADLDAAKALPCAPRDNMYILCARSELSIRLGEIDRALEYSNQALQIRPDFPRGLFTRGLALLRSGDAHGALSDLDRAIEIDSYSAESFWARSKAYEALSQVDKAEQDRKTYERLGYHPYL